jgi:hypothetical protein
MQRWFSVFIVVGILFMGLTFRAEVSYACSCVGGDALVKLNRSNAVFTGKVIEVGGISKFDHGRLREYTFQVEQAWKGVTTNNVTIYSYDGSSASCGFSFTKGEAYLVYTNEGQDGRLQTNLCNGNVMLSQAEEDLNLLGPATIRGEGLSALPQETQGGGPAMLLWYGLIVVAIILLVWGWRIGKRGRSRR